MKRAAYNNQIRGRQYGTFSYSEEYKQHIRELYLSGLSLRDIAKREELGGSTVLRWCKGVLRNKSAAGILSHPPDSTHWRTSRGNARAIMERHLGRQLETFEHVHHINHDFTDNRLENLQVLNASDHIRYHNHQKSKR